jgi:hypothetical protein
LTSQTKWNWSFKHFYIVYKLANKPFFHLEKERVGAHSLLSIKLENLHSKQTKRFRVEHGKGVCSLDE